MQAGHGWAHAARRLPRRSKIDYSTRPMSPMRLLPVALPPQHVRRSWLLAASIGLHALILAALLFVARRPTDPANAAPSVEVVFEGAAAHPEPSSEVQAPDNAPPSMPQSDSPPAPTPDPAPPLPEQAAAAASSAPPVPDAPPAAPAPPPTAPPEPNAPPSEAVGEPLPEPPRPEVPAPAPPPPPPPPPRPPPALTATATWCWKRCSKHRRAAWP